MTEIIFTFPIIFYEINKEAPSESERRGKKEKGDFDSGDEGVDLKGAKPTNGTRRQI